MKKKQLKFAKKNVTSIQRQRRYRNKLRQQKIKDLIILIEKLQKRLDRLTSNSKE